MPGTRKIGRRGNTSIPTPKVAQKPVKRPAIRVWRDAFGKDEVVQRVRPKESFDYIPNPHRGTTTFQRFQGDALCPTIQWGDRDGPREFPVRGAGKIRDNVKLGSDCP